MTSREILQLLKDLYPRAMGIVSKRIVDTDAQMYEEVFGKIPEEFISSTAAEFALRLLAYNRRMIREIALAS